MTNEEKRIKIAEACGWKVCEKGWWSHETLPDNGGAEPDHPWYFSDLNAMHAALKSQTQAFRAEFDGLLHAMAEEKHLLVTELESKDWADCFISRLQSQRDSGN
jgi:hypothetical protein